MQLHPLQYSPLAKHSQYNFKQWVFLQLQHFYSYFEKKACEGDYVTEAKGFVNFVGVKVEI